MGVPVNPEKAILFAGCLFARTEIFESAETLLREYFGSIYFKSRIEPWNYSIYYDREMVSPLYRIFCFFERIIDPSFLAEAKLLTNEIEQEFARDSRRQINLDPGYMTPAKVVLASTKNYSHRVYLSKGIYGEVALLYKNKSFHPLPYTYRDYRDPIFIDVFKQARRFFKKNQSMIDNKL
jgi:hypothetical protein